LKDQYIKFIKKDFTQRRSENEKIFLCVFAVIIVDIYTTNIYISTISEMRKWNNSQKGYK